MPLPATPMPRPCLSVISFAVASAAAVVQVDGDDVRAFLDEAQRDLAADAAARADHGDDLPREFLLRGHALELRFLEQPVFDVEGLLLRQRDVGVDRLRAAHDLDGAVVELGRDARLALVLAPGDQAEAGDEDDGRVGVAHGGRVGVLALLVVGGVVLAVRLEAGVELLLQRRRASPVCGFQST